ncbi:conserved hypothetical protein [Paraburkholderia atlantica]|uniref:Uncharacterized protein n=1 Tax=Paraburkholderia atlantica TaxID=2654982 RepID=D5WMG3_PARAM|nr:hypothetical protein [Paraburkholderia atlantica]ADG20409.1 conserved hypothetical protein [Paraburkholderia atlantica]
MTFHDYYLRAPTADGLHKALLAARLIESLDGGEYAPSDGMQLDVIGELAIFTGTGEAATLPGWHANLRMSRPLSDDERSRLAGFVIDPPKAPLRVWA